MCSRVAPRNGVTAPKNKMPLTAEYTWVESETMIQLQVPLKGQAKAKVDVFGENKRRCHARIGSKI